MNVSGADDEATREAALHLLFAHLSATERNLHVQRLHRQAQRGEVDFRGLLAARNVDGRLCGALFSQGQSDGTCFVWPPGVTDDCDVDATVAALFKSLADRLAGSHTRIAQCLVEADDERMRHTLNAVGFDHLADLSYQERTFAAEPLPPRESHGMQVVTWDEALSDRFARLIERTYRGSQDCPRMEGVRSGREAIIGHRQTGRFDPALWTLYRLDAADAGLLLINVHDEQQSQEVVYMGVDPQFRGRAVGRTMLLDGLHRAACGGAVSVVLAVDATNGPAIGIYKSLGFREFCRRSVHARIFSPEPSIGSEHEIHTSADSAVEFGD